MSLSPTPTPSMSVVIPCFNMGDHVLQLWQSIKLSGLLEVATEVLVIDDGSTDGTAEKLESLQQREREAREKLRFYRLSQNRGRFLARLTGAKEARGELIFFLDARVELPPHLTEPLTSALKESPFIVFRTRIDTDRNVFCLYWQRSHERIFSYHYAEERKGSFLITAENYSKHLKGTGALIVVKSEFLSACAPYAEKPLASDDTQLLAEMVRKRPILSHPELFFWWTPRERFIPFVHRLYERGFGLVEYHVFTHRGWIFWTLTTAFVGLILWLALLVTQFELALLVLALAVIAAPLSVLLFSRSRAEAIKMLPLHLAVLGAVAAGILMGFYRHFRKNPAA